MAYTSVAVLGFVLQCLKIHRSKQPAQGCIEALLLPAGVCKYTIHEDDIQWDVVKENWDQLSAKDKDRYYAL